METTISNAATIMLVELSSGERSLVPASWEDTVRVVSANDVSEAGRSLAHSFATDPLSHYLLDGDDMAHYSDEKKWKLHVDLMTYLVAAHCYKGLVTAIGPDYDAVALWYVFLCEQPNPMCMCGKTGLTTLTHKKKGSHLDKSWMTGGRFFAVECGGSTISSLLRVGSATTTR